MKMITTYKPYFAGVHLGHKKRNDAEQIHPFRFYGEEPHKNRSGIVEAHVTGQDAVLLRQKVARVVAADEEAIEKYGNRHQQHPQSLEQLLAREDLKTFENNLKRQLGYSHEGTFIVPANKANQKKD